jgi:hypothetical protein
VKDARVELSFSRRIVAGSISYKSRISREPTGPPNAEDMTLASTALTGMQPYPALFLMKGDETDRPLSILHNHDHKSGKQVVFPRLSAGNAANMIINWTRRVPFQVPWIHPKLLLLPA